MKNRQTGGREQKSHNLQSARSFSSELCNLGCSVFLRRHFLDGMCLPAVQEPKPAILAYQLSATWRRSCPNCSWIIKHRTHHYWWVGCNDGLMLQLGSRYSAATLNNLNTTSAEDLFSLVICGYIGGRCVQLKYPTPQHGHLAAKSRPLLPHLGLVAWWMA